MNYDCLIVDDEKELAESTCDYFNLFDVKSAYVSSKSDCLEFIEKNTYKLILLDINLADGSGFELCKQIRTASNVPILFISARTSDDDVLVALNIGGDDYIKKPYSLSILLAKVKAVLKRYSNNEKADENILLDDGRIVINTNSRSITVNGSVIYLKAMEYKLLEYLAKNKGRVVTKDEIFDNVWGDSYTGDGTLNVHIRHIREKIEEDIMNPRIIRTVWGVGYEVS